MSAGESNGAKSSRKDASVRPVVEQWLATLDLAGVDLVRAELAVALATQIDDDAAAYAVARLTTELRSLLTDLAKATVIDESGRRDVRAILSQVK